MEMKKAQQGFTLLVSVIFMSVMLSFGLSLASLGYKQQVLASTAIESIYAFYTANAALECALYADQKQNLFAYDAYDGNPKSMTCDGNTMAVVQAPPSVSELVSTVRFSFDSDMRCADVAVYKYNVPQPPSNRTTYLYAVGYDGSCGRVADPGDARFVARGLSAQY